MKDCFNSEYVWQPKGRGFSMGVAHSDGVMIEFTGQVAWDKNESIVGGDDVAVQTRQCYDNVRLMLQDVGGTLDDLVGVTTYYLKPEDLPKIQQERSKILGQENPPTSTSIMVAGLGHPDFLVEIAPVASIPKDRYRAPPRDGA